MRPDESADPLADPAGMHVPLDEPLGTDALAEMSREEISHRARSSAVLFGLRSAVIRAIGFASYLVFARFLTPAQLGVATVGLSIAFFGSFLADGGLGSGLIRSQEWPERQQLAALIGFESLVVTAFLIPLLIWTAVVGATVLPVTCTLYVAALLPMAFRVPGVVLLERQLEYRPLVVAEVAEVVAFSIAATALVVAGAGPIGLGAATILKGCVGTAVLARRARTGLVRPSFAFGALKPVLGFGLKTQAGQGVVLVRDQALNYGTAAISGLGILGIWALAMKIMLLPTMLFESLWRISLPSFARLNDSGEDLGPIVKRGIVVMGVATPLLLLPLVAGGPELIPVVLGDRWRDASDAIPFLCFASAISAPISTVGIGVLLARGEAGAVLRVAGALSAVYTAVAFALLPLLGVRGLGAGYVAGSVVDASMLAALLRRRLGVRVESAMVIPVVAGIFTAVACRGIASHLPNTLASGLALAAASVTLYGLTMWLFKRESVRITWSLVRRTVPSVWPTKAATDTADSAAW